MWNPINIVAASAIFCTLTAMAYARQKKSIMFPAGAFYLLSAASATFVSWPQVSPAAATGIFIVTLVLPTLCLGVFLIDYLFAPFCLEMRYLVLIWWALAPLAIPLNILGIVIGA